MCFEVYKCNGFVNKTLYWKPISGVSKPSTLYKYSVNKNNGYALGLWFFGGAKKNIGKIVKQRL